MNTAQEIWMNLHNRFMQKDVFRISNLQEEIYSLRQGNNSVSDYYTKQKILWDELENLHPPVVCPYEAPSGCYAVKLLREQNNADHVVRFLKGLNDTYASVRSNLMMMKPLPPITEIFGMVLQQERQLLLTSNSTSSVFSVQQSKEKHGTNAVFQKKPTQFLSKKPICTYCGMTGHTIDRCYKKHGYPPGSKTKGKINAASILGAFPGSQINTLDQTGQEEILQRSSPSCFTPEQYAKILQLLQSSHTQSETTASA